MAIELATAYVSLVPETSKLEKAVNDAFKGVGKQADAAGADIGTRLAKTASKAMKDGWRPDQDIMAGIPNTKLDRVGARMGQVIGKGISSGIKAQQLGRDFGSSFAAGAGSIGLGSVFSRWRGDLRDQPNKLGFLAGKGISAGLQLGLAGATAIIGTALKTGFDRLVALDTAQNKLRSILRTQGNPADFDRINRAVQAAVDQTPFSLDQAFGTAVQAIGAGSEDIERFMKNVTDAAGFAGTDLQRMGLIFTQILAKGKLTGEETMQLMEAGLPARSWIQKSYDLTAEQFDDMQQKGEITLDMLQKSVERFAPGMAKALGNTLQGSIDNMQTSLARTGANFLSAIFGGPTGDATEGLKSAVQRITEMLNNLNTWIVANKDNIREFFEGARDAAAKVVEVLGSIGNLLREHPGLITAAVAAFAAFKTIQGISAVATALSGVNVALGLMPGKATAALGPLGLLATALITAGSAAYYLGTAGDSPFPGVGTPTDPTGERGLANRRTGTSIMGVPSMVDDPIFGGGSGLLGGGGSFDNLLGPAFGAPAMGGVPGTAGRGYFNSRAASEYLDRQTVDAALLSNVPSGRYTQTASADLTQGLADCSSAVEDLVNLMDGMPTAGRSMSTANAEQWLTSRGFQPGTAPGAFNVGFNSGHMQATLPGGTPFNWGSDSSAANRGIGGSGAFDPALTQRFFRYDKGGVLPPGTTLVQNDTGKPELILNPEQQQRLADQGVDPNTLLHGTGNGASPGPLPDQVPLAAQTSNRSEGFVPVAASNTGVAGTSMVSSLLNMGSEAIGGVIDMGAQAASMAASAAMAAGTFGASAAGGGQAASAGIQIAADIAKRGVSYGFQMAGIGADALISQLFPFGAPRWLGYDYTAFAPSMGGMGTGITTLEKAQNQAAGQGVPGQEAGGPVNPETMPGMATPITEGQGPTAPVMGPGPMSSAGQALTAIPTSRNMNPDMSNISEANVLQKMMGYDQGGMLPPGGVGINMTNRPEPVLTPQQWDALAANDPVNGAPLVKIDAIYGMSPEDVANKIESKQKLAMMRYAGRP